MARIRGYVAASLDGFIATADDRIDWLLAYDDLDYGQHDYRSFLASIATVVMGRGTYDFLARDETPWAYGGKRVFVATSHPIAAPKGPLEVRDNIDDLVAELRSFDDGDVWMLGGGRLQMAFIERGALDDLQIFVMPELIGGGRPLFPPSGVTRTPRLIAADVLGRGCLRSHYAFD